MSFANIRQYPVRWDKEYPPGTIVLARSSTKLVGVTFPAKDGSVSRQQNLAKVRPGKLMISHDVENRFSKNAYLVSDPIWGEIGYIPDEKGSEMLRAKRYGFRPFVIVKDEYSLKHHKGTYGLWVECFYYRLADESNAVDVEAFMRYAIKKHFPDSCPTFEAS